MKRVKGMIVMFVVAGLLVRALTAAPVAAKDPPKNLVVNGCANGTAGWRFFGDSGISTATGKGGRAFHVAETPVADSYIYQDVVIPTGSGGKYLVIMGRGWVARAKPQSITRHPYLYGYQLNGDRVLVYMQGQEMRHTAAALAWQAMGGVFRIDSKAETIRLFLEQAWQIGDPPDGTRCLFDDIEMRVFNTLEDALCYWKYASQ